MEDLNEIEQKVYSELLKNAAENNNKNLNIFSNWIAVSLSAAIVLVIPNIDKINTFFDMEKIKISIYSLLASILLIIIQKYLSMFIKTLLNQIELGNKLDEKYQNDVSLVDYNRYYDAIENSFVWYLKWIYKLQRKTKNSNPIRSCFKLTQIEGTLVLLQLLLVLFSLGVLVFSLRVI